MFDNLNTIIHFNDFIAVTFKMVSIDTDKYNYLSIGRFNNLNTVYNICYQSLYR